MAIAAGRTRSIGRLSSNQATGDPSTDHEDRRSNEAPIKKPNFVFFASSWLKVGVSANRISRIFQADKQIGHVQLAFGFLVVPFADHDDVQPAVCEVSA